MSWSSNPGNFRFSINIYNRKTKKPWVKTTHLTVLATAINLKNACCLIFQHRARLFFMNDVGCGDDGRDDDGQVSMIVGSYSLYI
jgi:hypothetical protein